MTIWRRRPTASWHHVQVASFSKAFFVTGILLLWIFLSINFLLLSMFDCHVTLLCTTLSYFTPLMWHSVRLEGGRTTGSRPPPICSLQVVKGLSAKCEISIFHFLLMEVEFKCSERKWSKIKLASAASFSFPGETELLRHAKSVAYPTNRIFRKVISRALNSIRLATRKTQKKPFVKGTFFCS